MAQGPTPDTPVRLDANPLVPVRFGITGGTVRTPQCLSHLCLCIISAAPPKFRSALTWRAATAAQPSPPPPPPAMFVACQSDRVISVQNLHGAGCCRIQRDCC